MTLLFCYDMIRFEDGRVLNQKPNFTNRQASLAVTFMGLILAKSS